jgi:hypothetical protein
VRWAKDGGRSAISPSRRFAVRPATPLTPTQIDWRDAFRPFIQDWRYIVWALLALGLGVPLASVGNFLPQIGTSLPAVVGFPRAVMCSLNEHGHDHEHGSPEQC